MIRLEAYGRLTRDPELKDTTNSRIAKMSIAVAVPDNKEVGVCFLDFSAWPPMADKMERYRKGDQIYVIATGKTRKYQAKDGTNKTFTEWWPVFISGTPSGGGSMEEAKPKAKAAAPVDDAGSDVPF